MSMGYRHCILANLDLISHQDHRDAEALHSEPTFEIYIRNEIGIR
jgi:hypothetical protein